MTARLVVSLVLLPAFVVANWLVAPLRPDRGLMPSLPGRSDVWTIEYLPVVLLAAVGVALALRERRTARTPVFVAALAWNALWLGVGTLALFTLWGEFF